MGQAIGRITGTSETANEIMKRELVTEDGFLVGFNRATHTTLSAGFDLNVLNREAIRAFALSMDVLSADGPRQVSLYSWIQSEILRGTTDAVYGDHNPFRDQTVEKAW
ncbi:unnamed protein product [Discula destructiva]